MKGPVIGTSPSSPGAFPSHCRPRCGRRRSRGRCGSVTGSAFLCSPRPPR